MSYSATIRIKKDYKVLGQNSPCKRDGTASLYLQMIIEGTPKKLPLELSWPPELFNEADGTVRHSPTAANALHRDEQ